MKTQSSQVDKPPAGDRPRLSEEPIKSGRIKLSWDPDALVGTGIPTSGPMVDRRRAAYQWLSRMEPAVED